MGGVARAAPPKHKSNKTLFVCLSYSFLVLNNIYVSLSHFGLRGGRVGKTPVVVPPSQGGFGKVGVEAQGAQGGGDCPFLPAGLGPWRAPRIAGIDGEQTGEKRGTATRTSSRENEGKFERLRTRRK